MGSILRAGLVVLLAFLVVAGAACDDDDPEVIESTPANGDGSNGDDVISVDSGNPQVDYTVDAALDGNILELAELTAYQQPECEESPEGAGAPPACREGEEPGSAVEVFPVLQCELMWTRPEDVPDVYERIFGEGEPELVAVYEAATHPLFIASEYGAVLRTPGAEGTEAVVLWINRGRIVNVEHDCGNVEGLYAEERVKSFLIAPE